MYNIKENARTHLCLQSKRLSSGAVLEEVGPADSMRCRYQPLAMNHMSQMDYLCVVREMLAKGVQVFDAVQCNELANADSAAAISADLKPKTRGRHISKTA